MGVRFAILWLLAGMVSMAWAVEPGEESISRVLAMGIAPAKQSPPRGAESEGPFEKLVIKGAYVIEGAGAPARGPVNIYIENDRITFTRPK